MHGLDAAILRRVEQYMPVFAREAGRLAMTRQRDLSHIWAKDDRELDAANIVTEADQEVGELAEDFFSRIFPGCVVIHEEQAEEVDPAATPDALMFISDPIDGTLLYAAGGFAWTVSVGCFYRWQPMAGCVYAPQLSQMFHTAEGLSLLNGTPIQARSHADSLVSAVMLRHIKAYHDIDDFPGYTLCYGGPALHLCLVASGFASACVTSRHRVYDVAGAAKILENAGAELRFLSGERPPWEDLVTNHTARAPDHFFACPEGDFERLSQYVKPKLPWRD
jgi:fructose-1,6-bisphosphatase/inositol monophosphatase family enzyme